MPSLPVLTYGGTPGAIAPAGTGIDLLIGKTLYLKQRAVMDDTGVRYLYTHFQIGVRFICHLRATQHVGLAGLPVPPVPAGVAWPEIRRQLMQPRKHLIMKVGTAVILESPQRLVGGDLLATDANQGPQPIDCYAEAIIGQTTIVGVFVIETWLVECKDAPTSVLSHQWEQSEDLDDQFLSTRTTSGRIVFRPELLARRVSPGRGAGLRPDDFRVRTLHPVPPGYRRQSIHFATTADGTGCNYRVVDREKPWGTTEGVRRVTQKMTTGYNWLSQVNPSYYRTWTVTLFGYPRMSSLRAIQELSRVFATASTMSGADHLRLNGRKVNDVMGALGGLIGAGDPFAGDILTFTRRRPYHAITVDLDLDTDGGPVASFSIQQTLGKTPLGIVDVFFVAPPLGADYLWPENAGLVADINFITNPEPYSLGTSGFWRISLLAQALVGRCDVPPVPTHPGSAIRDPALTS